MVIHHSSGLHVGVAGFRTNEFESSLDQIFTHGFRFKCSGGDFIHCLPGVFLLLPAHKLPNIGVKTAELLSNGQKCSGIPDSRHDLESIADNSAIQKKLLYLSIIVPSYLLGIKAVKCLCIAISLIEDS